MDSWQSLENSVRSISEVVWCAPARPKTLNDVKCDCVIEVRSDYWVLIEISKSNTLAKLRDDLAKFATVRLSLFSKNIYSECYFISTENHPSLIGSGKGLSVEVHSPASFATKFLGFSQYLSERPNYPFGSAVDPDSGKVDASKYVEIRYTDQSGGKHTVSEICKHLKERRKIVLLGEFGSGKSRCLMEVFHALCHSNDYFAPIAINLRDNWGYKKFSHILHNHLDELGLGQYKDSLVRSIRKGNHPILLDGFDEIGSQSWSGDIGRLAEIRKGSLQGVRDLLAACSSNGVLITGREHYFNTDREMLECLGLDANDTLVLACPNEFSELELKQYIEQRTKIEVFPAWLPKKPLLCQLLTRIEASELSRLVSSVDGEVDFFDGILDAICYREARIHPTIFKDSLRRILLELASISRTKDSNVGPISPQEISAVFEQVTGSAPIDESAIVLQRLPYLGRSGSDSAGRIFIDDYAVDGLRALALVKYYFEKNEEIRHQDWRHPLGQFGYKIVGTKIHNDAESIKYFKNVAAKGNQIAACDFVGGIISESDEPDFKSLRIDSGRFSVLDLCGKTIINCEISSSEMDLLIVENTQSRKFFIDGCIAGKAMGVTSKEGFPSFITNTDAELYEEVLTASRISELNIDDKHKTLLSILKKLFFQPGKGRKEEALLRGAEKYWDEKAASRVLSYMMKEKMVDRFKGDDGWVYFPTRSKTERARKIMSKLSHSTDELWDFT